MPFETQIKGKTELEVRTASAHFLLWSAMLIYRAG
jgi:hypothetical protein